MRKLSPVEQSVINTMAGYEYGVKRDSAFILLRHSRKSFSVVSEKSGCAIYFPPWQTCEHLERVGLIKSKGKFASGAYKGMIRYGLTRAGRKLVNA